MIARVVGPLGLRTVSARRRLEGAASPLAPRPAGRDARRRQPSARRVVRASRGGAEAVGAALHRVRDPRYSGVVLEEPS
jgi:hypothetical protein